MDDRAGYRALQRPELENHERAELRRFAKLRSTLEKAAALVVALSASAVSAAAKALLYCDSPSTPAVGIAGGIGFSVPDMI